MTTEFGKVKSWYDEKGYGFIRHPLESQDIFVHHTSIRSGGAERKSLERGQTVQFRRSFRPDGRVVAMDVMVVEGEQLPRCEACGQEIHL